uniref:Uncharacterized protein n=1 Tax=Anguilla anguilla TaxID=7936 RepID=A0A0E9U250_ANGAN
MTLQCPYS